MIEAAPHDATGNPTHRSRLIVLAGPTAVGKGTVAADVRRRHPEVWISVSATTRDRTSIVRTTMATRTTASSEPIPLRTRSRTDTSRAATSTRAAQTA